MVVNCSGVKPTGTIDVSVLLTLKGEISKDISSTAVNHVDTTATRYHTEGVVAHVSEAALAFTANVGDGVYTYFL